MTPITADGYRLFHEGQIALAKVEQAGMRVDTDYIKKMLVDVDRQATAIEDELKQDPIYKLWTMEFGSATKLGSDAQLGRVLYGVMGYPCKTKSKGGKDSTSEEALKDIDLPFVQKWLLRNRLRDKVHGTYLKGLQREVVDGFIHPSLNLNTVWTMRGCVAKGTLIEVVRDVSKYPAGIPIESVRIGDYVYCYDANKELTIKKVLSAGMTGTREVIRIHWRARKRVGYVDVTPEHLIRVASGKYVEAINLLDGSHRADDASKHTPLCGVLSLGRLPGDDRLYATGHRDLYDHRLVFECTVGELRDEDLVHHKDGNHFNNVPGNLELHTASSHAALHAKENFTPENRAKGGRRRGEMIRNGELSVKTGQDHPNWKYISRFALLRIISRAGGKIANDPCIPHDYSTLASRIKLFRYDLKKIKNRYDCDGRYISIGRLKKANEIGRTHVMKTFGLGFARTIKVLKDRGLSTERRWANQQGSFSPHNHTITAIERINKTVDVYDLEVEDVNNFIAGELCVHNSCTSPNAQNIPARVEEHARTVRTAFIPRKGHRIIENDFKMAEVMSSACYHHDPMWVSYCKDATKDMHRDSATKLFLIDDPKDVTKACRNEIKANFVFAQMYGSYYIQCAQKIWDSIGNKRFEVKGVPLKEHLRKRGIRERGDCDPRNEPRKGTYERHVKDFEKWYWKVQYPVYDKWKADWYANYQQTGYVDLLTGFRLHGYFSRNQTIDAPIQGAAFHWLLWLLIKMVKWIERNKMRSRVICQIHDSLIGDVHEDEVDDYLGMVKYLISVGLRKHWEWINVPVTIEAEITDVDANWFTKKQIEF